MHLRWRQRVHNLQMIHLCFFDLSQSGVQGLPDCVAIHANVLITTGLLHEGKLRKCHAAAFTHLNEASVTQVVLPSGKYLIYNPRCT